MCTESVYYKSILPCNSPEKSGKVSQLRSEVLQASICTPANMKIVASVTAEFAWSVVRLNCYGGPFTEGNCCEDLE